MNFKYLEKDNDHPLIQNFYQLSISDKALPFTSLIIPLENTNITYVFCEDNQIVTFNHEKILYKGLTLTGQFYGSYHLEVVKKSNNLGFSLKPTALYKILNEDISQFNNQHIPLKKVSNKLNTVLENTFITYKEDKQNLVKSISKILDELPLSQDANIKHVENAINFISENEGLIRVSDLLEIIPLSQKSLENQFKKIVGLTPGKYIRRHKFICLMQKYNSKNYELHDLLHMFDYYDTSHFTKDFKLFMGQTPTSYFKQNYPLLEEYLK